MAFDSIIESKHKCRSDNEAKKICNVMTLDDKIKILHELGGAAVDITFR